MFPCMAFQRASIVGRMTFPWFAYTLFSLSFRAFHFIHLLFFSFHITNNFLPTRISCNIKIWYILMCIQYQILLKYLFLFEWLQSFDITVFLYLLILIFWNHPSIDFGLCTFQFPDDWLVILIRFPVYSYVFFCYLEYEII